jgi:hypothetical protein
MVLIKNVLTTSKEYQYLKIQQYIIIIKVIDKVTWACLPSQVAQQIANCSTYIKKGKFFFYHFL